MIAPPERLSNGRYSIRGVLGEGAQGVTYDAVTSDGRPVAIKRFDVRGARSWKDVELAEREARVLAALDHPFLPRYLEHFEQDGSLYLVMERVEGETLDAVLRREGSLPESEVRRFLTCADRALTYLHGRPSPVVHRDVKPRNVIRRPNGAYVLVDFGAVSEMLLRRGGSTVVGTIGYMAPEQLQGRALPATDVYGVGATALAALTGKDPDTLPHAGLRVDVRAALRGRASDELTSALAQMLEPDPDRRAPSVGAALTGVRPHPPPRAPTPSITTDDETSREDALVKSVRNLLWVLWGLSWVIIPPGLRELGHQRFIPLVMFGALAGLLVVTWHKGALLRAGLRSIGLGRANAASGLPPMSAAPVRHRVEVDRDRRVRVHAADLDPIEVSADTELGLPSPVAQREQRAR